jgi:hypothetical protein
MPPKDGVRLNDLHRTERARPEPGHPYQQRPVTAAQLKTRDQRDGTGRDENSPAMISKSPGSPGATQAIDGHETQLKPFFGFDETIFRLRL